MAEVVHHSLARRDLLPSEHLVHMGCTDVKVLIEIRREYRVEIVGPVAQDSNR